MNRLLYALCLLVISCSINAMSTGDFSNEDKEEDKSYEMELKEVTIGDASFEDRLATFNQVAHDISTLRQDVIKAGLQYMSSESFNHLVQRLSKKNLSPKEKERLIFANIAITGLNEINKQQGQIEQQKTEIKSMRTYKDQAVELGTRLQKERRIMFGCSISLAVLIVYSGVISLQYFA